MKRPGRKRKISTLKQLIDTRILTVFALFFIFVSVFLISDYLKNTRNATLITRAEDLGLLCDDPPSCCSNLEQTGDPFECDWPYRKYCRPGQCNIPEGVNRQRCGVAYKEIWPWGCVCKPSPGVTVTPPAEPTIYDSYTSCPANPTATPVPPTAAPPTLTPVFRPTSVPTGYIYPTAVVLTPVVGYPTAAVPTAPSYTIPTGLPYIPPGNPGSMPTDAAPQVSTAPQNNIPSGLPYIPPGNPTSIPTGSAADPTIRAQSTPALSLSPPVSTSKPFIREAIREADTFLRKARRAIESFLSVVLP